MKIAILGGAFNPPHLGHLTVAQEVLEILGLDKVFFIPTNISPHKKNEEIDPNKRMEMVRLAISDNPKFQALDVEIKREGISFTIDTVRQLKTTYPEDEFYLITGSDLANSLSSWKDCQLLKKEVTIIVVNRQDYPLKEENSFELINITQLKVSSSQIRAKVKNNYSVRYLTGDKIANYIQQHNLYK